MKPSVCVLRAKRKGDRIRAFSYSENATLDAARPLFAGLDNAGMDWPDHAVLLIPDPPMELAGLAFNLAGCVTIPVTAIAGCDLNRGQGG